MNMYMNMYNPITSGSWASGGARPAAVHGDAELLQRRRGRAAGLLGAWPVRALDAHPFGARGAGGEHRGGLGGV